MLQALYNQSDDTLEYQLRDRLSFRHFMGLGLEDAVPDAKTLWLDQETLAKAGALEGLFKQFDTYLKAKGYFAMRAVERPRDCRRPQFLSRMACYEQDNYQIFT